jgi:hypothetical protein
MLTEGYIEHHHIVMKSLGGNNDSDNIVALTGREHYVAHLLLHKIHKLPQTSYALWMMQMKNSINTDRPCIKSSRMYEWARKEFAKYISKHNKLNSYGKNNSQYGTRWICNVELKQNRKILNTEIMPSGWVAGRNKWKISIRQKLKLPFYITNGILNKKVNFVDQDIPEGWVIGHSLSEATIKNISERITKSNINRKGIRYKKMH